MTELALHGRFPHHYECRHLLELPGVDPLRHFYYPGGENGAGIYGLMFEISPPEGEPWLGIFAVGAASAKGVFGIFTTPDPTRFCVMARGEGYLVSANDPVLWERVAATPVLDIRLIPERSMLVFADFTHLVAYGPTGLKWRSCRLAMDGLEITHITDTHIIGDHGDRYSGEKRPFMVELETGKSRGGMANGNRVLLDKGAIVPTTANEVIKKWYYEKDRLSIDLFELKVTDVPDDLDKAGVWLANRNLIGSFYVWGAGTSEWIVVNTETKENLIVRDSEFTSVEELIAQLDEAFNIMVTAKKP